MGDPRGDAHSPNLSLSLEGWTSPRGGTLHPQHDPGGHYDASHVTRLLLEGIDHHASPVHDSATPSATYLQHHPRYFEDRSRSRGRSISQGHTASDLSTVATARPPRRASPPPAADERVAALEAAVRRLEGSMNPDAAREAGKHAPPAPRPSDTELLGLVQEVRLLRQQLLHTADDSAAAAHTTGTGGRDDANTTHTSGLDTNPTHHAYTGSHTLSTAGPASRRSGSLVSSAPPPPVTPASWLTPQPQRAHGLRRGHASPSPRSRQLLGSGAARPQVSFAPPADNALTAHDVQAMSVIEFNDVALYAVPPRGVRHMITSRAVLQVTDTKVAFLDPLTRDVLLETFLTHILDADHADRSCVVQVVNGAPVEITSSFGNGAQIKTVAKVLLMKIQSDKNYLSPPLQARQHAPLSPAGRRSATLRSASPGLPSSIAGEQHPRYHDGPAAGPAHPTAPPPTTGRVVQHVIPDPRYVAQPEAEVFCVAAPLPAHASYAQGQGQPPPPASPPHAVAGSLNFSAVDFESPAAAKAAAAATDTAPSTGTRAAYRSGALAPLMLPTAARDVVSLATSVTEPPPALPGRSQSPAVGSGRVTPTPLGFNSAASSPVRSGSGAGAESSVFVQYEQEVERARQREQQRRRQREEERERFRKREQERREQREREHAQELEIERQRARERERDDECRRDRERQREEKMREHVAVVEEKSKLLDIQRQEEAAALQRKEIELTKFAASIQQREAERRMLAEAQLRKESFEREQRERRQVEEKLNEQKHQAECARLTSLVIRRQAMSDAATQRFEERKKERQTQRDEEREKFDKQQREAASLVRKEQHSRAQQLAALHAAKAEEQNRVLEEKAKDLASRINMEEERLNDAKVAAAELESKRIEVEEKLRKAESGRQLNERLAKEEQARVAAAEQSWREQARLREEEERRARARQLEHQQGEERARATRAQQDAAERVRAQQQQKAADEAAAAARSEADRAAAAKAKAEREAAEAKATADREAAAAKAEAAKEAAAVMAAAEAAAEEKRKEEEKEKERKEKEEVERKRREEAAAKAAAESKAAAAAAAAADKAKEDAAKAKEDAAKAQAADDEKAAAAAAAAVAEITTKLATAEGEEHGGRDAVGGAEAAARGALAEAEAGERPKKKVTIQEPEAGAGEGGGGGEGSGAATPGRASDAEVAEALATGGWKMKEAEKKGRMVPFYTHKVLGEKCWDLAAWLGKNPGWDKDLKKEDSAPTSPADKKKKDKKEKKDKEADPESPKKEKKEKKDKESKEGDPTSPTDKKEKKEKKDKKDKEGDEGEKKEKKEKKDKEDKKEKKEKKEVPQEWQEKAKAAVASGEWKEKMDKKKGVPYYANKTTKESTYNLAKFLMEAAGAG